MLDALIGFSLKNRFFVILATIILIVLGIQAAGRLPLDAFPDTTPVQVQINTMAPSLGAEEVERLITFPIEYAMGGLKGLTDVRSISKFGLSQVVLIFSDDTDIYFARQQIMERLTEAQLPAGIGEPTMGPVATGVGEIYHYIMRSDTIDLTELRTLNDWVVRPWLRRVAGVAEVNPWGGLAKQFEVCADPAKLAKYKLTFDDLVRALRENNQNVGGGYISSAGMLNVVQGLGRVTTTDEIAGVVITARQGVPIRVRDVADVVIGHMLRRGGVTAEAKGPAVLGLAFMRMGENSRDVSNALDAAMDEVREMLPEGVEIEPVYMRTHLVDQVLHTVEKNLLEGAVLVVAVLFAFLGNLRAGLIVASAIPLSMLFAVSMMERVGIAGSLMSLGAIDFGMVVDSSVVMIENCVRHLAHDRSGRSKLEIIRRAASEVRKPTMFGELIIMIVYLPILALQGVEGKLFRPMALTVIFALAGSMVLSLTLMPALASLGLPRRMSEKETWLDKILTWFYRPMLGRVLRFPILTLLMVGALVVAAVMVGTQLGSEFIPRLYEQAIVINTIRHPSISLEESERYGARIEEALKRAFPDEIEHIWTRTGTPEIATDPMGMEASDIFITLTPRSQWTHAESQEELAEKMKAITDKLPGMETLYTQPIEQRINEMIAGIRADLGVKLYGDDLETLKAKAAEIERVVASIPGASDVSTEQIIGLPVLQVTIDHASASRFGVSSRKVLDAIEAVGGMTVGEIIEPNRRFPLVIRLPGRYRSDPDALEKVLVPTAAGERIPLTRLVEIERVEGPAQISREWGKRRIYVQANVRGRDMGSFVEEAQRRIDREVQLPEGYFIKWGGQFENMIRASNRLMLVVPLALGLILSLLYLTFNSVRDALMIFSGVLYALVGGMFGLYGTNQPFTISAGVGFIALAGAAVLQGLVLVSTIRDKIGHGLPRPQAVREAALARLRPVLMTGTVAALGFIPMMLSTGIGAEIQRPLATVVVYGMVCANFLTMLALPALYLLFGKGPEPQGPPPAAEAHAEGNGEAARAPAAPAGA